MGIPLVASTVTQVDSDSELIESFGTVSSEEIMSEDAVTFDLDLEDASIAQQEIGKVLVKETNDELVQEAKGLVEERYASFVANLPSEVHAHNPDIANDLRDTWMKENYFTTLRDFMHVKNNSFRSQIDLALLSDDDKQRAKDLHLKLHRDNEVAVQEAMQQAFDKYCEKLDDVQRKALSSDEAIQSLRRCWLPSAYVSIVSDYIDFERDKFRPHPCIEKLTPDEKVRVDELSLKLKSSDEAGINALVQEAWTTYDANMDLMVKQFCDMENVKSTWMIQNYPRLLQLFVNEHLPNEQHVEIATTPPPSSLKRCASTADLEPPLSPMKTARKDSSLPPVKSENLLPPSAKNSRLGMQINSSEAQADFTSIEELGQKLAISFSVVGKIMASNKEVQILEAKNGKTIPQFRYVLADHTGIVEVTKIGAECYNLMKHIHALHNETVLVTKAVWNDERKQLQHKDNTGVEPSVTMADSFNDVKFPMHDDYTELPKLPKWTRASVHGFVCDPGESILNKQDGKSGKGWVREATIANSRCQGMTLRIVHPSENDLDFFAVRKPIVIKYAKTFPGGLYADLHDLSQIDTNDSATAAMCPDISSVRRVSWI